MKYKYLFYIGTIIFFAFTSCGKSSKCIKSNGKQTTQERTISSFNTIEINGKLDVELVNSSNNIISVSCGENLLNFVKTEIKDSTLVIDNENKCNWLRSYKNGKINIKIPTNNLKHLKINGLGKVFSNDTIYSENLKIEFITGISDVNLTLKTTNLEFVVHDGGGDLIFRGESKNTNVFNNGYAKLDMLNLKSGYFFLASKSQNQTLVNVSDRLDVEIYDVGDVYYSGNPQTVNLETYSTGKLIELN